MPLLSFSPLFLFISISYRHTHMRRLTGAVLIWLCCGVKIISIFIENVWFIKEVFVEEERPCVRSWACVTDMWVGRGHGILCMSLQTTSGDSSLTTIISDLQSAQPGLKPKVIYGHGHFHLSPSIIFSFLSVRSSSPAILFRHFKLCLSPLSFSPLRPPYFYHCLLSVNSFFLFLVCWPRLTYFSLSLFQLSLLLSGSLTLSPPSCLCGPFPYSLALPG